jgi:hypothetical protein
MRLQLATASHACRGGAVRQIVKRYASGIVGAGFLAISMSASGADLGNGYATAIALPSQPTPSGRRSMPSHLIDPPGAKPDRSAERSRIVDQLYEELMRWTPPGCSSGASNAAVVGRC